MKNQIKAWLKQHMYFVYRTWYIAWFVFKRPYQFKSIDVYKLYADIGLGFIAVPKNANTTIQTMVLKKFGLPFDARDYDTVHVASMKFSVSKEKLFNKRKDIFILGITRNPYSRLVSCYNNKIVDEEHGMTILYSPVLYRNMSFDTFARRICKMPDWLSDNHFKSQTHFLFYKDKQLYTYIGKIEKFDELVQILRDKFDLPAPVTLNVSKNKTNWRDFYTPDLARMVYKRYKKDFELFGYKDEPNKLINYCQNK